MKITCDALFFEIAEYEQPSQSKPAFGHTFLIKMGFLASWLFLIKNKDLNFKMRS